MSEITIDWEELDEQFPLLIGKKKETKLEAGIKYLAIVTKVVVEPSSKNQQLQIVYDLLVNRESGDSVPVKKFTQLIPEHENFVAAELEFFGIEINHMSEISAKLQKLVGLEIVITVAYKKNFNFPVPTFISLIEKNS